jgi:hypothetical protein
MMTIDVFRGRLLRGIALRLPARSAAGDEAPTGIAPAEDLPDTSSCPACGRPLEALTGICPGCGARLVLGVQARRAGVFVAAGLVSGLLVGSLVIGLLVGGSKTAGPIPAAAAETSGSDAAIGGASGSGTAVPSTATSVLRQTATINARLVATLAALRATLSASPYDASATAQGLRDLAADATVAAGSVPALGRWPAAASVQANLAAFYDGVLATARTGLAYSLSDAPAYRKAASEMVARFRRLPAIDAAARALASTVGISLPAVYPGATGSSAAP